MWRISEAIIRHVRRRKTFEEEGLSENDAWDLAEKMFDSEVRKMKYLSVCSGIEAATVAWHPLGWEAVGYSEIEKFPSLVLEHHYPNVPNFGDMTKFKEWNLDTVNLLVGGTPCQSFSVAGLRKGLEDPRGNLALVYCGLLDHFRPKWFVWENVPGVLSSGGGRDFGSFLGAVAELGYGFAYRVLDAQYFGVAQRRRRVFVVGYFGDWRPAAEVLFEPESLCRDTPPSRKKGEVTPTLSSSGTGTSRVGFNCEDEWFIPTTFDRQSSGEYGTASVASTIAARDYKSPSDLVSYGIPLTARMGKGMNSDCHEGQTPVLEPIPLNTMTMMGRPSDDGRMGSGIGSPGDPCPTITKAHSHAVAQPVAYSFDSLASNSMKSSNPHSGCREVNLAKTLDTTTPEPSKNQGGIGIIQQMAVRRLTPVECERLQGFPDHVGGTFQPIVLEDQGGSVMRVNETGVVGTLRRESHGHEPSIVAPTLTASNDPSRSPQSTEVTNQVAAVYATTMAVRRLTPVECERLQGFPDNYTDIKPKGKDTPDGPRYKALGNSMAVPCMSWLGKRIQMVEDMTNG